MKLNIEGVIIILGSLLLIFPGASILLGDTSEILYECWGLCGIWLYAMIAGLIGFVIGVHQLKSRDTSQQLSKPLRWTFLISFTIVAVIFLTIYLNS
ncbi:hypothetical protein CL654_03005 [bacterium]|nr:hypothetical protein [bacterium]